MKENILTKKLRNINRALNHADVISAAVGQLDAEAPRFDRLAVLEFHPSDLCDISCVYCTYRFAVGPKSTPKRMYPYSSLDKLVELNPRAIVLVGGGEPMLYKSEGKKIGDLVDELKKKLPDTELGLTTNGAILVPRELWPHLAWIRVSLDAANHKTFAALKDGDISQRMACIFDLLEGGYPEVGVGFLYNRVNFTEVKDVIELLYSQIRGLLGEDYVKRVNIQFRPTCPIESCDCPSEVLKQSGVMMTPDKRKWWQEARTSLEQWYNDLDDARLASFIDANTNFHEVVDEIDNKHKPEFDKCYTSLIRWVLRSNGDIYSCVMNASNQKGVLGNLLQEDVSSIWKKAIANCLLKEGWCRGPDECCRFAGKTNEIIDRFINRGALPQENVTESPFF